MNNRPGQFKNGEQLRTENQIAGADGTKSFYSVKDFVFNVLQIF